MQGLERLRRPRPPRLTTFRLVPPGGLEPASRGDRDSAGAMSRLMLGGAVRRESDARHTRAASEAAGGMAASAKAEGYTTRRR